MEPEEGNDSNSNDGRPLGSSPVSNQQSRRRPFSILTVGDGDLTLSLSLVRAYGDQMNVTATTLCSNDNELCQTYSNSAGVIEELLERKVTIFYGIDATQLTTYRELQERRRRTGGFDLILFHHPHLGLLTSTNSLDEQKHATRHFVLLAHYLASASSLLSQKDNVEKSLRDESETQQNSEDDAKTSDCDDNQTQLNQQYDGRIHLCLAHDQPHTWRMEEAAKRLGLQLVKTADTYKPFHGIIQELNLSQTYTHPSCASEMDGDEIASLTLLPHKPGYSAPRRYRNGKLGSKHFFGRYGYQHRRTYGSIFDGNNSDMNVEGSRHYFFAIPNVHHNSSNSANASATVTAPPVASKSSSKEASLSCAICGLSFGDHGGLQKHLKAPALPDPPPTADADATHKKTNRSASLAVENEPAPKIIGKDDSNTKNSHTTCSKSSSPQHHSWNIVEEKHEGIRLRRFLHQVAMTERSKKQCDTLITDGLIHVNGSVAIDTGRILKMGDTITLELKETEVAPKIQAIEFTDQPVIRVVSSFPPATKESSSSNKVVLPRNYLIVVHKPVGMTPRGYYESSRTLEKVVSWQMNDGGKYKNLSNLDKGCGGLCVLRLEQEKPTNDNLRHIQHRQHDLQVKHEFTALVYGHVPDIWNEGISAEVPWQSVRLWRRGRDDKSDSVQDVQDEECSEFECITNTTEPVIIEGDNKDGSRGVARTKIWMMDIRCVERTSLKRRTTDDKCAPAMSTVKITTVCTSYGLCRAICHYLRNQKYPVVGDRMCPKEYQRLPRSIRNRLKNKLCLGCFQVTVISTILTSTSKNPSKEKREESDNQNSVHTWTTAVDTPDKFRAGYWQQHWESATVVPGKIV